MPTHNIPERDEELFLLKKCNEICDLSYDYNDSPWLRPEAASKILGEVAAFSARQAREKAIEECIGNLPKRVQTNPGYDSLIEKMTFETNSAYNTGISHCRENIELLKSTH